MKILPFALLASVAVAGHSAQSSTTIVPLGSSGGATTISTVQPSLAVTALLQTTGHYLSEIGQIRYFAGGFAPGGFVEAHGQLLQIAANSALFSLLGTTYGGDGSSTFAVPDLRGRTAVGSGGSLSSGQTVGSATVSLTQANLPAHSHGTSNGTSTETGAGQSYSNMQPGLALDFEIVTQGIFPGASTSAPGDTLGFVQIDAAIYDGNSDFDRGKQSADGTEMAISENQALYSLIGNEYGGNFPTDLALPDVQDRIVTGAGLAPGLSQRDLGQTQGTATETMSLSEMPAHTHSDPDGGDSLSAGNGQFDNNLQPELAMNWMIALEGMFPDASSYNSLSSTFLGEISLFAGTLAPRGWALANGQLLSIAQNQSLFSLLGTTYGGDGVTTFALPDFRGRTAVGASDGESALGYGVAALGSQIGSETILLDLPEHSHTVSRTVAPVPLPASIVFLFAGLGLLRGVARRGLGQAA